MSRVVLDGSMTMAWCFADEATEETASVLSRLDGGEAFVPEIWPLEVANSLLVAERRKRLSRERSAEFAAILRRLPIRIVPTENGRSLEAILDLAREAGLTSYDATYLDLALRLKLPLATLDEPLRRAAKARGVPLLPA